ncbi:hypothetical protein D9758_004347 [Tetrapyrgos nigripes]|uniref:Uncharacterized protein n=1 Tax=Tetrapyrgos nigripes TaxID=182062 RepID=A0A8H5GNA4_9AGAR|nr:hypothetical protein D9758_004347 [Tetrapyrgos nigripes]
MDYADGMRSTDIIYDDTDPHSLKNLPQMDVCTEIIAADKLEGYIRSYIILPPTVYGIATGPIFEAGISNPHSTQIPILLRASMDRRRGGMIGMGKNVWPNVEIHELAELYNILLDSTILHPDSIGHGCQGIYNAVNGEYSSYQLAEGIGQALVDLGYADNPIPLTFSTEEENKYFGSFARAFGTNSRCLGTRSKSLGWNPKLTTEDMLKGIKPEIEALMATRRIMVPQSGTCLGTPV